MGGSGRGSPGASNFLLQTIGHCRLGASRPVTRCMTGTMSPVHSAGVVGDLKQKEKDFNIASYLFDMAYQASGRLSKGDTAEYVRHLLKFERFPNIVSFPFL